MLQGSEDFSCDSMPVISLKEQERKRKFCGGCCPTFTKIGVRVRVVSGGEIEHGGCVVEVEWISAPPPVGFETTIESVEECIDGVVQLASGQKFQNPLGQFMSNQMAHFDGCLLVEYHSCADLEIEPWNTWTVRKTLRKG